MFTRFGLTKQEFQDSFFEELVDLIHDSDNFVKIKALESAGQLTNI